MSSKKKIILVILALLVIGMNFLLLTHKGPTYDNVTLHDLEEPAPDGAYGGNEEKDASELYPILEAETEQAAVGNDLRPDHPSLLR